MAEIELVQNEEHDDLPLGSVSIWSHKTFRYGMIYSSTTF